MKNRAFPSGFESGGANYLFWGEHEIDMAESTNTHPPRERVERSPKTRPRPTPRRTVCSLYRGQAVSPGGRTVIRKKRKLPRPGNPATALVMGVRAVIPGHVGNEVIP